MPQLSDPHAETVMEGGVRRHNKHELSRADAIKHVKSMAFRDVVDSFHVVDGRAVPARFYTVDDGGLSLTDDVRRVMTRKGTVYILGEIEQRWAGLEVAWKRRGDGLAEPRRASGEST